MPRSPKPSHSSEEKLDKLLAAHPVTASSDFTEQTLRRLQQRKAERSPEEALDELLWEWPVEASPDFPQKILAQIDAKAKGRGISTVLLFPKVGRWIGGVAAVLALVFGTAQFFMAPPGPTQSSQIIALNPSLSKPSPEGIDPLLEEIFILTESLREIEIFLDENTGETLAYLADY